jgi:hypothetical protein
MLIHAEIPGYVHNLVMLMARYCVLLFILISHSLQLFRLK